MHQDDTPRVSTQWRLGRAVELIQLAQRRRAEGSHRDAAYYVYQALQQLSNAHKTLHNIGQGER